MLLLHGAIVAWCYCCMMLLLHGAIVTWCYCYMVLLLHGAIVTWCYCYMMRGGVGWGECTALSPPSISRLSKAPNPQLLPGRRTINGCPLLCVHGVCVCVCVCVFTAVCVHFGWVKCRARILSMGHHTWLYVMSLSTVPGLVSYCFTCCLFVHVTIIG